MNNSAPTHFWRRPESSAAPMNSKRLPLLNWASDSTRKHFVAGAGEFAGTFLFLFTAFSGTQVALVGTAPTPGQPATPANAQADTARLLYISLCFGFSLAVNAWVFFRISGGLFNPAVTLGMCLIGALPIMRGIVLFFAQMLGALSSAAVVSALFPGDLSVRTSLGGGTTIAQGLFIEMFLTAQLVFTIFMLAAEKHKSTYIAPVGIGLSLFIAELTGVYFTGGSLNPARSFAPSAVTHQFHHYHWLYWVGPILGSLLASAFYYFIKALEYETANPGQESEKDALDRDLEQGHSNGTRDYAGTDLNASDISAPPAPNKVCLPNGTRRNHKP